MSSPSNYNSLILGESKGMNFDGLSALNNVSNVYIC